MCSWETSKIWTTDGENWLSGIGPMRLRSLLEPHGRQSRWIARIDFDMVAIGKNVEKNDSLDLRSRQLVHRDSADLLLLERSKEILHRMLWPKLRFKRFSYSWVSAAVLVRRCRSAFYRASRSPSWHDKPFADWHRFQPARVWYSCDPRRSCSYPGVPRESLWLDAYPAFLANGSSRIHFDAGSGTSSFNSLLYCFIPFSSIFVFQFNRLLGICDCT